MAKIPRIERLLNLVACLLRARAPMPWAVIKERVAGYDDDDADKTLERRFERDKRELRDMGIPVDYTPADEFSNEGYLVRQVDCFLPALDLAPEDAAVLSLIGRVAEPGLPPELAEPLRSAIRKLSFSASDAPDVLGAPEEQVLFTAEPRPAPDSETAHLDAVVSAIAERKAIRFRYYAISHDDTRARTVDPYGVGFHEGHWYLVARDHGRGQIRSFRIDRIRTAPQRCAAGRDEPDFEPPEDFRLADHLGRQAWELPEEAEAREARIRLDPTIAWMVRENPPRDGQFEDRADGGAILTVRTQRPDALVRWVLRLGTHAEVLAPEWLRARCAHAVQRLAERYEGGEHD